MKIAIVGAHGQIAMHLHPMLKERGHQIRGLIRKAEQADDLEKAGAEPVVCDVEKEEDISDAVGQQDVVIFAAGAGPGSGAARKWSMDRDGAIKLIEAARKNNIKRYIMISAMGLDDPRGDEVFKAYQKAKAEADEALKVSGLQHAIIKPGRLTNEKGTGRVTLDRNLSLGEIPREDVAAVIAEILVHPDHDNLQLDLISGDTPIKKAVTRFTQKTS